MKTRFFLIFIFLSIFIDNSYTQYKGDLTFFKDNGNSFTCTLTVRIHSALFDGMTDNTGHILNRLDSLQNACFFRHFGGTIWPPQPSNISDWPLTYYQVISPSTVNFATLLDLGHCAAGEIPDDLDGGWGFGIYEIRFDIAETNEHYLCFFNCLDSKYGKPDWNGTNDRYSRDWFFRYDGSKEQNRRVIITDEAHSINEILSTYEQGKEYKVWKLMYNRDEPFAKDFFVRTTPFPFSPEQIDEHCIRNLVLGTNVIIDDCLPNSGQFERQGYNTFLGNATFPNYFTNPPIPSGCNQQGNTFVTPAWYYFDYNTLEYHYGTRINALTGDKLTIKNNKKLWISGYHNPPYTLNKGDTLIFSPGSNLELGNYAEIHTCFGGCLSDSGSNKTFNNYSRLTAFENSEIGF